MAGLPLLLRSVLGSQLTQPLMNEVAVRGIGSGFLSPEIARLLYSDQTLGGQLANSVEPIGRLLGLLPQERTQTNLPEDYYVTPSGITSSAGEPMITDQGRLGFAPQSQYSNSGFDEPMYTPPLVPEQGSWTMQNIPSQIPEEMSNRQVQLTPGQQYQLDQMAKRVGDEISFGGFSAGPTSYQPESSYFNPIGTPQQEFQRVTLDTPDLGRNLPTAYAPSTPSDEEDEERERFFMSAAPTTPVTLKKPVRSQEMARGGSVTSHAAIKNKQQKAAKIKAQLMLRAVPMPNEYRQGGRVRMI